MNNQPTEPGMYFAKECKDFKWFNLIVQVAGNSPFLYISWVVNRSQLSMTVHEKYWQPAEWGPKIAEPEDEITRKGRSG